MQAEGNIFSTFLKYCD